jgi:hypothetical protein
LERRSLGKKRNQTVYVIIVLKVLWSDPIVFFNPIRKSHVAQIDMMFNIKLQCSLEFAIRIVYGYSLWQRICGVGGIIRAALQKPAAAVEAEAPQVLFDATPGAGSGGGGGGRRTKGKKKRAAASPSPA